ncbi:Ubiquitin-conjugating enzyme E2 K [Armadillidium vulgare]|nr:Ubiquitin-conjugating enzyme E2 K [Armadillidium vulgare]
MGDIAIQRIKREFKEVIKSDEAQRCTINIELVADNYKDLRGKIAGPPDTPYEGGTFHLEIKVPETYPFSPPKVKFLTRIWHPNISSATGAICLDILKDQAAAMTLRTVLLSLQALLAAAEPDDPQDAVVARQYKENHSLFFKTAQYWTYFHAGGEIKTDFCLKKFENLKIWEKMQALVALSTCDWELVQAIDQLFS